MIVHKIGFGQILSSDRVICLETSCLNILGNGFILLPASFDQIDHLHHVDYYVQTLVLLLQVLLLLYRYQTKQEDRNTSSSTSSDKFFRSRSRAASRGGHRRGRGRRGRGEFYLTKTNCCFEQQRKRQNLKKKLKKSVLIYVWFMGSERCPNNVKKPARNCNNANE